VALLLSKSGESAELLTLLEHLRRFGARTIALTGAADSTLGRECDAILDAWVKEEACPHDLRAGAAVPAGPSMARQRPGTAECD
jgi:arabinose-5-phosphate isomerase